MVRSHGDVRVATWTRQTKGREQLGRDKPRGENNLDETNQGGREQLGRGKPREKGRMTWMRQTKGEREDSCAGGHLEVRRNLDIEDLPGP